MHVGKKPAQPVKAPLAAPEIRAQGAPAPTPVTPVTPDTTRLPLADAPSIAATMMKPSSLVAVRTAKKPPSPAFDIADLLGRVRDANYKFDDAVLEVGWFREELSGRNGARGIPHFASDFVHKLTFPEIERMAGGADVDALVAQLLRAAEGDDRLRRRMFGVGTHGVDASDLVNAARSMLAYRFLMTVPDRGHLTTSELTKLAAIEGREVTTVERGYRFDSRAPRDIVDAGGFFPNPARVKKSSLFEHSVPGIGSFGGGYVSLSRESGNAFNLAIGPVVMGARKADASDAERDALIAAHAKGEPAKIGAYEVLRTWEYELHEVTVVTPEERYAIAGEKELVAASVEKQHIARARPVTVVADVRRTSSGNIDSYKVHGTELGAWRALDG